MKRFLLVSAVVLFGVGCGGDYPMPANSGKSAAPATQSTAKSDAAKPAETKPADTKTAEAATKEAPKPAEKQADPMAPTGDAKTAEEPGTIVGKAEVGVGAKGHYNEGIITTPVSVMFRSQEMIAFKIQIPQAMNLFKAENNRAPKSNEEFMEKIIKANMIALPELREGQRFVYDPKTEQLMVEERAK